MRLQDNHLRVLFWNVQSWGWRSWGGENMRLQKVLDEVSILDPDVACFAECVHPILEPYIQARLTFTHRVHSSRNKDGKGRIITLVKNSPHYTANVINHDFGYRHFPLIELEAEKKKLSIIPLHTPSGTTSIRFETRKDTWKRVFNLAASARDQGGEFLTLGDMNTMGLHNHKGPGVSITPDEEINIMSSILNQDGVLQLLPKTYEHTWLGIGKDRTYPPCNLDHALASPGIAGKMDPVYVGGWPDLDSPEDRTQWVRYYSDHAYLVVDIPGFKAHKPARSLFHISAP